MVKVKDIAEIYLGDKSEHLNKDVYIIVDEELVKTNWVHHIGNKIILSLRR